MTKQLDLVWGLISQKINTNRQMMIRLGVPFNKTCAKDLMIIDKNNNVIETSDKQYLVHPASQLLISIHEAKPDANVVVHSHDEDVSLFSALNQEILPINQDAMLFQGTRCVNYAHDQDYPIKDALKENTQAVNLLNHGSIVWGSTLEKAMMRHQQYFRSCRIQMRLMSIPNAKINIPSKELIDKLINDWENDTSFINMDIEYNALLDEQDIF